GFSSSRRTSRTFLCRAVGKTAISRPAPSRVEACSWSLPAFRGTPKSICAPRPPVWGPPLDALFPFRSESPGRLAYYREPARAPLPDPAGLPVRGNKGTRNATAGSHLSGEARDPHRFSRVPSDTVDWELGDAAYR